MDADGNKGAPGRSSIKNECKAANCALLRSFFMPGI